MAAPGKLCFVMSKEMMKDHRRPHLALISLRQASSTVFYWDANWTSKKYLRFVQLVHCHVRSISGVWRLGLGIEIYSFSL